MIKPMTSAFLVCSALLASAPVVAQTPAQRIPSSGTIRALQISPAMSPQTIQGQLRLPTPDGGTIVVNPSSGAVTAAAAAESSAASALAQQKQNLLKALTFDRRPSSILRAWALPDSDLLPKPDAESTAVTAQEDSHPETAAGVTVTDTGDTAGTGGTAQDGTTADTNDGSATESENDGEMSEEEKAAAEAAELARKQAEEAQKQAEEQQRQLKEFELLLARLQLLVTRGQWDALEAALAELSEEERTAFHQQLLASLLQGPPDSPRTRNGEIIGERNLIRAEDVIALAELNPSDSFSSGQVSQLGQLVRACQNEGEADYAFLEAITQHVNESQDEDKVTRRVAAKILFAAGRADEAMGFLPELSTAQADEDLEALDLLTDTFLAMHGRDGQPELLENAWNAIQSILEIELPSADEQSVTGSEVTEAVPEDSRKVAEQQAADPAAADTDQAVAAGDSPDSNMDASREPAMTREQQEKIQQKALRQAVKLVPRLRDELGQQWLADSFTREAERGRRILNGIGSAAARNMAENGFDTSARLETLTLQQTAVEAVLQHVDDADEEWAAALHLMAVNWLREAVYSSIYDTSTNRGPRMSRDVYGNYFWTEDSVSFGRQVQNGMPQAIPSGKLLDTQPSQQWLRFLQPTFYPTLAMATARLHLRVKEEAEAFPFIERLAPTHPEEATELVRNFLSTWADNHDPNSERRRTGVYMFSFGYNERLSGIPLTRSHQERNLTELAEWVGRIRQLPLDDVDETWISSAFTRVHSSAEVYQIKDLEGVFGSVDEMKADTLASLLLTMRTNLSSVWRMPQVQQDAKTNRKKKDIESEVNNGYETALTLCRQGLDRSPDNWRLLMVQGALLHDLNNYQSDIEKTTSFTKNRREALDILRQAARAYVSQVKDLKETEYTVEPFNTWFYATLGDSQIGQITQERHPLLTQIPTIEEVFSSLPAEVLDRHRDLFANDLFARMSTVNPAVKFRYVREGLKLVGDRPQAREARQVFDYYNDLVTEIQLQAELDGTPRVGHGQPFGVLVSIRHTKAIERESGGFSRYLQNQNSGGGYYYNNGRPNEDYRDKFEQATRDAVDEHFEVLSVTFEPEKVSSRPDPELGWRVTPYAYVLLKARGPEVDRIPPLRLDLDFLDTTGYVILPVESPSLSVDCSAESGDARPLARLALTQTLDEREADNGRLILEVRATGQGLIPELDQVVDASFADFEVTSIDDNKLSVSRFDPDSSEPVVLSERLWTLTLQDRSEDAAQNATEFAFPQPRLETQEIIFQRYDDADLKAVDAVVALERRYDEPAGWSSAALTLVGLGVVAVCGGIYWVLRRRPAQHAADIAPQWVVPKEVTPFSVLALLRQIERNNGLSPQSRDDLSRSISRIEQYYFSGSADSAEPDLASEAKSWVSKAR